MTSSAIRQAAEPLAQEHEKYEKKSLMDIHTVEDLQRMTAADLLAEPGSKRGQMRHFTGMFIQHPILFVRN